MAERLVRGIGVAGRLVRGAAVAKLLLAREPPAQRTAGRDVVAELLLAGNHRHRGLPAGTPMRLLPGRDAGTEQGALLRRKGADNAKAPLRGRGAGRKQELARGVRS